MMVALTEDGQRLLDRYLQQIRFLLRGCRTVDAADVERDVMEHIERELHDAQEPVASTQLDPVLQRLGKPEQWIPQEELPWWRRMVLQLRTGPEDYRLAYLSLGLLVLGFSHPVFLLASFLVSRAALEVAEDHHELRSQRWLIYPSLILVYLLLLFAALCWPTLPVAGIFDHLGQRIRPFKFESSGGNLRWMVLGTCAGMIVTGLWWTGLGLILRKWPRIVPIIFRPFGDWFDQKWAKRWVLLGLGICLTGVVGLLAVTNSRFPLTVR